MFTIFPLFVHKTNVICALCICILCINLINKMHQFHSLHFASLSVFFSVLLFLHFFYVFFSLPWLCYRTDYLIFVRKRRMQSWWLIEVKLQLSLFIQWSIVIIYSSIGLSCQCPICTHISIFIITIKFDCALEWDS